MIEELQRLKVAFINAYECDPRKVEVLVNDGVVIFQCEKKKREIKLIAKSC